MLKAAYPIYEFPESQSIVISGDIHGDFNAFVNKTCVQYQMRNTLIIVAGDCGFGFEKKGYYENMVKRNTKRMTEANNRILFVRGNHDNPAYFDGSTFRHKRFMAVPDYSVVKACGHTLLCVGGAISIDRTYRQDAWMKRWSKQRPAENGLCNEAIAINYYWANEAPVFNRDILDTILSEYQIDTLITHTAPSFCELQSKNGITRWAADDRRLVDDVQREREVMDSIYEMLRTRRQPVTHWCYGHFHQSWHSSIEGTLFKMLDIMELYELPHLL